MLKAIAMLGIEIAPLNDGDVENKFDIEARSTELQIQDCQKIWDVILKLGYQ